ncbi:uncharacterized protein DUF4286 [Pontibacter ummariensis]|uniref:DUF4286 domain-containing protein n=1 Tax=Pontibacter ummariensis TaxID=1610492 RepID=A0A239CT09_9BACT|nr:DUF4286 family protein [Pontibacter ummariensis]PRY14846.1 uncharacterized protein DUF4286 [Pontibacter ummariensis]SNS23217.1 protein of unknown function [Pontibacter ummariensis]
MILYNETVNIENGVAEEWLQWMKEVHIPEVMRTGYFLRNQVARLIGEVNNGGTTYAVQYSCRNMADLEEYKREHADALYRKQLQRYEGKFVIFSSMLEVVGVDVERDQQED